MDNGEEEIDWLKTAAVWRDKQELDWLKETFKTAWLAAVWMDKQEFEGN